MFTGDLPRTVLMGWNPERWWAGKWYQEIDSVHLTDNASFMRAGILHPQQL